MRNTAGLFNKWHALNRSFQIYKLKIFIHALIESRFLILIAHADQQSLAFAMKIKRPRKINDERKIIRNFLQWTRCEYLPAKGNDRDIHARHFSNMTRPRSRRVQYHARLYHAKSCLHIFNLTATDTDSNNPHIRDCLYSKPLCGIDISHHHAVWINCAIFLVKCPCDGIIKFHQRQSLANFFSA